MKGKKLLVVLLALVFLCAALGTVGAQAAKVTIEFIQWWAPELPAGSFQAIMNDFEAQNPGIAVKLISGPYSNTRDQIVTGAATGTVL